MEFENKELDMLIESIGQWIIEDESRPGILNPIRMGQLCFSNTVLERLSKDADVKVSSTLHEPFNSMGSICVEGDALGLVTVSGSAERLSLPAMWKYSQPVPEKSDLC